jgi:Cu/Zn superoxide dismutase
MLNISASGAGVSVIRVSSQGGTISGRAPAPRRGVGGRMITPIALPGLLDADGAAIVIHAEPDDYHTDPSGNSGARIACGVIVPR